MPDQLFSSPISPDRYVCPCMCAHNVHRANSINGFTSPISMLPLKSKMMVAHRKNRQTVKLSIYDSIPMSSVTWERMGKVVFVQDCIPKSVIWECPVWDCE